MSSSIKLIRRRYMFVIALAACNLVNWSMAADDDKVAVPKGAPTVTEQGYKISVVKVRPSKGEPVLDFDAASMVENAFQQARSFASGNVNAGGAAAAGSGGAAAGGGGFFVKPNIAVDLVVDPPASSRGRMIVEVVPTAKAVDNLGNELESPKFAGGASTRMSDDPKGINRGTLLFHHKNSEAKSLETVEGELKVTPGKIAQVKFREAEFKKGTSKQVGDKTVRIDSVKSSDRGIEVVASISGPDMARLLGNPQEMLRVMQQIPQLLDIQIIGTDGNVYYPDAKSGSGSYGDSSGGGGVGFGFGGSGGGGGGRGGGDVSSPSAKSRSGSNGDSGSGGDIGFGFGGGGGGGGGVGFGSSSNSSSSSSSGTSSSTSKSSNNQRQGKRTRDTGGRASDGNMISMTFHFQALPAGVDVYEVVATVTQRTGESKRIPFTLTDVPLSFPREKE